MSESTIRRYLDALERHDGTALLACYNRQASYSDPIHPDLRAERVAALMRYRMACVESAQAEVLEMSGDERKAQLHWRIRWRPRGVPGARRRVLRLSTSFAFWDDSIARQVDEYPPWAYLGQVHGLSGLVTGWLPSRLERERARAAAALEQFMQAGASREAGMTGLERVS